jgi:hypothetical protein
VLAGEEGRVDLDDVVGELGPSTESSSSFSVFSSAVGSFVSSTSARSPSTGNFLPILSGAMFVQARVPSVSQTLTLRMSGRSARSRRTIEVELSPTRRVVP